MHNVSTPPAEELPSSRALMKSTLIAVVVAAVLLVTVVLPAEYGVDPTGVGRVVGLTRMGEIKMELAREAAAADAAEAAAALAGESATAPPPAAAVGDSAQTVATDPSQSSHVTELSLAPGEGKEIKLVMKQGGRATYSWSVAGGVVNYDTHGDPPNAPRDFYHGYGKGTSSPGQEGVLQAAFDGSHGWFWRNRTDMPVTVTLRTEGEYSELRELY